jgi:hypothetical protein
VEQKLMNRTSVRRNCCIDQSKTYLTGETAKCVNYGPSTCQEIVDDFHARMATDIDWPSEVWNNYLAPIIRLDVHGEREAIVGTYGMVSKKHIPPDVKLSDTLTWRKFLFSCHPSAGQAVQA